MVRHKKSRKAGGMTWKIRLITWLIWLGCLFIAGGMYYVFPEDNEIQNLSIGLVFLWIAGTLMEILQGADPEKTSLLPFVTNKEKSVLVGLGVVFLLTFLNVSDIFSVFPLFSVSPVVKMDLMVAALVFVVVATFIEEKNWGQWVQPSVTKWAGYFVGDGVKKGLSPQQLILGAFVTAVTFAVFHAWFGSMLLSLVVGAFTLRVVIYVLNYMTMSYYTGWIIHAGTQANAIARIFELGDIETILFVFGVISIVIIIPYYVLPKILRSTTHS